MSTLINEEQINSITLDNDGSSNKDMDIKIQNKYIHLESGLTAVRVSKNNEEFWIYMYKKDFYKIAKFDCTWSMAKEVNGKYKGAVGRYIVRSPKLRLKLHRLIMDASGNELVKYVSPDYRDFRTDNFFKFERGKVNTSEEKEARNDKLKSYIPLEEILGENLELPETAGETCNIKDTSGINFNASFDLFTKVVTFSANDVELKLNSLSLNDARNLAQFISVTKNGGDLNASLDLLTGVVCLSVQDNELLLESISDIEAEKLADLVSSYRKL